MSNKRIWKDNYLLGEIYKYNHGTNARYLTRINYMDGFKYNILHYPNNMKWNIIKENRFDIVKLAIRSKKIKFKTKDLMSAVELGNINFVKWLYKNTSIKNVRNAVTIAAQYRRFDIIKWIFTNKYKIADYEALKWAAQNGDLEIMIYIYENTNVKYDQYIMENASRYNHIKIVKWLIENISTDCTDDTFYFAINNNNLEMLKLLCGTYNYCRTFYGSLMTYAVEKNKIEIAEYLYTEFKPKINDDMIKYAAKNGNLDFIKLITNKTYIIYSTDVMDWAAMNGHLEIVKYLHENINAGCTTYAMDRAAKNGHLDVVIWLHKNRDEGCTTDAMDWAINYGHLNVVIWLHENRKEGCSDYVMDCGFNHEPKQLDMVKWLYKNKKEFCVKDIMYDAFIYKQLNVIKWLYENTDIKYDSTEIMDRLCFCDYIKIDDFEIIKFLHEKIGEKYIGCIMSSSVIKNDNREIFLYLFENMEIKDIIDSLITISKKYYILEYVKYICKNNEIRKRIKIDEKIYDKIAETTRQLSTIISKINPHERLNKKLGFIRIRNELISLLQ